MYHYQKYLIERIIRLFPLAQTIEKINKFHYGPNQSLKKSTRKRNKHLIN